MHYFDAEVWGFLILKKKETGLFDYRQLPLLLPTRTYADTSARLFLLL
jgi:hypothetical protein